MTKKLTAGQARALDHLAATLPAKYAGMAADRAYVLNAAHPVATAEARATWRLRKMAEAKAKAEGEPKGEAMRHPVARASGEPTPPKPPKGRKINAKRRAAVAAQLKRLTGLELPDTFVYERMFTKK